MIPIKPLTNYDLLFYAKELNIPHFRGVYMRDTLPKKPRQYESSVINLDSHHGTGTHWVCYMKRGNNVSYFDSFGNLRPPIELVRYFGPAANLVYNYERQQNIDSVICGHLCLKFLASK